MTSDVTLTGAANNANKTVNAQQSLNTDFTQFLTLLTTQLQNQDPLNPMDSSEFTNQLVQFSQVEQQINSNQKLDNLVSLQMSNATSAALGYVGLDITYASAELNYDGAKPVTINYGMGTEAKTSQVNIFDEEGTLVYSGPAAKDVGPHEFVWDGTTTDGLPVDPGTYSVVISAVDDTGAAIDVATAVSGRVHGIESQNGVVTLLVGNRAVPVSNVINAKVPADSGTGTDTGTGADSGETDET
jgi:flagellar basal-body rod modification protein FlgD